ncbi:MAG: response regulator transcription factor [Candidatus Obscuribacterales bacterium]|nr:response regulator transcription factor [Candidatus Obscuribacterales bacterium]
MPKILVVDDDVSLAANLHLWLKTQSYDAEMAHNAADALQLLRRFGYDLMILDWQLPDKSGVEILQIMRSESIATPVIMLTGLGEISNRTTGLDSGADDYMVKPVVLDELASRIRAVLRRPAGIVSNVIKTAGITLDTGKSTITVNGEERLLTRREFALLRFFISNPNKFFSAADLLARVWESDKEASEESVRTCIKTLRKKLALADDLCPIQTVKGSGYIFSDPVSQAAAHTKE